MDYPAHKGKRFLRAARPTTSRRQTPSVRPGFPDVRTGRPVEFRLIFLLHASFPRNSLSTVGSLSVHFWFSIDDLSLCLSVYRPHSSSSSSSPTAWRAVQADRRHYCFIFLPSLSFTSSTFARFRGSGTSAWRRANMLDRSTAHQLNT